VVQAVPQAVAEQVEEPRRAAGDDDPVGPEDGQLAAVDPPGRVARVGEPPPAWQRREVGGALPS